MAVRNPARLALLPLVGSIAACGTIWGFDDATPAETTALQDDEVVPAQGATGVVCVPRPPAEWQGPLVIDEKSGDAWTLEDCPAPYANPIDAFAELVAEAPACDCACGPPDATCAPPVLSVYADDKDCAGAKACNTFIPTRDCPLVDDYPPSGCNATNTLARITTPALPVPGAACEVRSAPVPPARWRAGVRLCAPPSVVAGTCPSNKVATPVAPVRYEVNYCVATTGVRECPTSYPAQRVYYGDLVDTRACDCACGAATDVTCSPVTITGWDHAGAACSGGTKPVSDACAGNLGNTSAVVYEGGAPTGGRCAPTGGAIGAAEATRPTTVCCRR